MQKLAVKHVRDAYTRHDKWHLAAFLKDIGCAAKTVQEPVSKAEFERVKDNGLRALHPANQGQSCQSALREVCLFEIYHVLLSCITMAHRMLICTSAYLHTRLACSIGMMWQGAQSL